jgi:hypothetical protein
MLVLPVYRNDLGAQQKNPSGEVEPEEENKIDDTEP